MEERGTHLFRKLLDEPAGSSDKALNRIMSVGTEKEWIRKMIPKYLLNKSNQMFYCQNNVSFSLFL